LLVGGRKKKQIGRGHTTRRSVGTTEKREGLAGDRRLNLSEKGDAVDGEKPPASPQEKARNVLGKQLGAKSAT